MNPATVLGLWLAFVIVLPVLRPAALAVAGLALLAPLLKPAVGGRFRQLLRRSRLLLLLLLAAHLWATPAQQAGFAFLPTREAAELAGLQAARFVLLLASLAWVLARLGQDGVPAGLYLLLRPLGWLGVPVERFVVRLSLVLGEGPPRPARLRTEDLLAALGRPLPCVPPQIVLDLPGFGWRDAAALGAGLFLLVLVWGWGRAA